MAVVVATICVAGLYGIDMVLRAPQSVGRITVVNETPYLVDIEVTGASGDGWLKVGPVSPGEHHAFGAVLDPGDRWIFHATTGPFEGGEFSVTKTRLDDQDWLVTIPSDVERRLDAEGAVPYPGQP